MAAPQAHNEEPSSGDDRANPVTGPGSPGPAHRRQQTAGGAGEPRRARPARPAHGRPSAEGDGTAPGLPPWRGRLPPPPGADGSSADSTERPRAGSPAGSGGPTQPGLSPAARQLVEAWGSRPGRLGPVTVIFGALAGGLLTVLFGYEPGILLGVFVIIATAVAGLVVRPGASYLVIPMPAVAYFIVACIAGLIHDRAVDSSGAVLAANALQWIADGFLYMCFATVLAIVIAIGRWLMTGRAAYRPARPWATRLGGPPQRGAPAPGGQDSSDDTARTEPVPGHDRFDR